MNNVSSSIRAQFALRGGQTHLSDAAFHAPLKIAKTFPRPDGGLDVCNMDCSPGILAGDAYEIEWNVGVGTRVAITNQSFTRVHPACGRPSSFKQHAHVESGALLELFPEPTMLFAGANFSSDFQVDIESGGTLLFAEVLCAGRTGRGEVFQFESCRMSQTVRYGGKMAACSRLRVVPSEFCPQVTAAWGDYTHFGTFGAFDMDNGVRLREALAEILAEQSVVNGGVSLAVRAGVTASLLGKRAQDLQAVISRFRAVAREFCCHE